MNYPPGLSELDLPGNSKEDLAWNKFFELIEDDISRFDLDPEEAKAIWREGVEIHRNIE